MMQVACVIMAAGASRRFDANKLLAELAGRPVIVCMLELLSGIPFSKTVLVTGDAGTAALARAAGLDVAAPSGAGRSDTIRAGLAAVGDPDGCLFCVGDQPLLRRESLMGMLAAFGEQPERVIRLYSGEAPGNPVLFPRSLFPQLRALPPGRGGSWLLKDMPEAVVPVQASSHWELMDVDTPEQLAQLESQLRSR